MMQVTQIVLEESEQYPWTHRISFKDPARAYPVYQWTESNNIPGIWARNNFYTNAKYATIALIRWSHL